MRVKRTNDASLSRAFLHSQGTLLSGVRLVLLAGFLGLLGLLGFAGFYSLNALRRVASVDDQSTRDFVRRSNALEEIRRNTYDTNSRLRDFLFDREPGAATAHRRDAFAAWDRAMIGLDNYRRLDLDAQSTSLSELDRALADYWQAAAPALEWDAAQRETRGFDFLSRELTPLRDNLLHRLDEIRREGEVRLRAQVEESARFVARLRGDLTSVVLVALLIGLTLAAVTWTHFLRLEGAARLRYQISLDDRAQLEALSARLLEIQEEERRKISRELHDEAGQALSGLLVDVANASAELGDTPSTLHSRLDSIRRSAESTLASIRNMSLLLRPSMLDDLGLVPALQWQARETERRTGMKVAIAAEDHELELPDEYRTTIYRVVQEALNNAARHSGAKAVSIVVRAEPTRFLVLVQDDGIGFDPSITKGMGLLGMHERIGRLNGHFYVESEPGSGVALRIELPPLPAHVS